MNDARATRDVVDLIHAVAADVGPSADDVIPMLDDISARAAAAALTDAALIIEKIIKKEGFNADPARRRANAECVALLRSRARKSHGPDPR